MYTKHRYYTTNVPISPLLTCSANLFARVVDPAVVFIVNIVDLFFHNPATGNVTVSQAFQQVLYSL